MKRLWTALYAGALLLAAMRPCEAASTPVVTSPTVTGVDTTFATLGATVSSGNPTERGTVWNTSPSPTTVNNKLATGTTGNGTFTQSRTGLPIGTQIYFRGYAINATGTGYSSDGTFFTEPNQATALTFPGVADVSMQVSWTPGTGATGAIVLMRVTSTGTTDPVDGTTYTGNSDFTLAPVLGSGYRIVYSGSGNSVTVTGLTTSTTYDVVVYAYSGSGTLINYQQTTPLTGSRQTLGPVPTVTSPAVTGIDTTFATLGATVVDGAPIAERGTVWNTSPGPTTANNKLVEGGTGTGTFTQARTGLPVGSQIYFRGYALNATGTGYSSDGTFFTEPNQATALTFSSVADVNMQIDWTPGTGASGAIVLMRVTSSGTTDPVDGTTYTGNSDFTLAPVLGSGYRIVYSGTGNSVMVSGLTASTAYDVAVYAYSGSGSLVNYRQTTPLAGSQQTRAAAPAVTSPTATAIDTTTATLGATVVDGAPITERGTVWSTSPAPTTANNKLAEGGTATGTFTQARTGMPVATQIYFRGYAINANGTGYSPDGTFFTEPNPATGVTFGTPAATSLSFTWTSGGGSGALVIARLSTNAAVAPVDGTVYTASTTFGAGSNLGGGNYVVYAGVAAPVTVNGLRQTNSYSVDVYEYAWSGSLINFQQHTPATGTQTTAALPPGHNGAHNVQCYDCHYLHATVPRGQDQLVACASCHNPTGLASAKVDIGLHGVTRNSAPFTVDCGMCHEVHNNYDFTTTDVHPDGLTTTNISRIRWNTTKYVPEALEPALYQNPTNQFAFGQANSPWNGICQTCHTNTIYHTSTSFGDHSHNLGNGICTDCHKHQGGFLAACSGCHSATVTGAGGTRRPIIGEFSRSSHHLQGATLDESDCQVCHDMGQHKSGKVRLVNVDGGAVIELSSYANPSANATEAAKLTTFCIACHDANGANGNMEPFSDGLTRPVVPWTASSSHNSVANLSCFGDGATFGCHGNGHGSQKLRLLAPADVAPTAPAYAEEQEGFCYNCHDANGPSVWNIQSLFGLSNHHPVALADQTGKDGRATECTVCHNPHAASRTAGLQFIDQVWGVNSSGTIVNPATEENQLCFRCHSAYTGLGGSTPGAGGPDPVVNKAAQFMNTHVTFHPVVYPQNNDYTTPSAVNGGFVTMEAPFNQTANAHDKVWCSDCHRDSNIAGPHGSADASMLRASLVATNAGSGYYTPLCVLCHKISVYLLGGSGSRFSGHNLSNHPQPDFTGGHGGCLSCHYGQYLSSSPNADPAQNMVHGGSTGFGYMSGTRIVNWAPGTCTVISTDGCRGHTKTY